LPGITLEKKLRKDKFSGEILKCLEKCLSAAIGKLSRRWGKAEPVFSLFKICYN
jgi:hypothetical protein